MQNQQQMIIFAGPSLTPASVKLIDDLSLDLREPVRRGDIQKLLNKKQVESIAIVDGLFNQVLSRCSVSIFLRYTNHLFLV